MKTKQKLIDEVMDYFDFSKVLETVRALNWIWVDAEDGIPQEHELRLEARRLMNEVYGYTEKYGVKCRMGTGGFYATYDPECPYMGLEFCVAIWEAGGEV